MTAEAPSIDGDTIYASLWYPRNSGDGIIRSINVGLYDVRAAGPILITYDFKRDGYVITQEVFIDHETWLEETGEFVETAFVPAWITREEMKEHNDE